MRKYLIIALVALIFFINLTPITALAQVNPNDAVNVYNAVCTSGRFIPCDGTDKCPCTFVSLMQLVDNVLSFLTNVIAFPLAVITFTYAGFLYMTTAVSDQRSRAKGMMVKVVIGFAVLLSANLIVKTVLGVLLEPSILNKVLIF
jgi:hypothetical protein